jgi:hypothetical protein
MNTPTDVTIVYVKQGSQIPSIEIPWKEGEHYFPDGVPSCRSAAYAHYTGLIYWLHYRCAPIGNYIASDKRVINVVA